MNANHKFVFPPELKTTVPPIVFALFVDMRKLYLLMGGFFCIGGIFGPVVGPPDHNGFSCILVPLFCPLISAILIVLKPFNPFNGYVSLFSGVSKLDESGPEERRLIELFDSKEARRFIWITAAKLSGLLFVATIIVMLSVRNSLNWSFQSPGFGGSLLCGFMGSWLILFPKQVYWGLMTWATREVGS